MDTCVEKLFVFSNQAQAFVYGNIIVSLAELFLYGPYTLPWTWNVWVCLGLVIIPRLVMALVLVVAFKLGHSFTCKFWAFFESLMILAVLTLFLTKTLKSSTLKTLGLVLINIFKWAALCLVYYASLAMADKEDGKLGRRGKVPKAIKKEQLIKLDRKDSGISEEEEEEEATIYSDVVGGRRRESVLTLLPEMDQVFYTTVLV